MSNFDDRLRSSLSVDDEEFLKNLEDERGVFTQFTEILHGPMAPLTWIASVFTLVFTVLGFYSAWQVFQADDTRGLILWLMGFFFSLNAVSVLKMWMFGRMNTLSILREVKRLELRVAYLAEDK